MAAARSMRQRAPAALLALCIVLAVGCGDGEPTYDADGFIAELNAEDPVLALGEPLTTTETDQQLYGVEVIEVGGEEHPQGEEESAESEAEHGGHEHGGGSLIVAEDEEEAQAEHQRCETALSLLCYRAANIVVRVEDLPPDDRRRMDHAFMALGAEES